jgi:hypothetical protein
MKRTGFSRRKSPGLPIDWRAAERAMLQANAADTCNSRVSDDIFDVDDERAEVDVIVHSKNYALN